MHNSKVLIKKFQFVILQSYEKEEKIEVEVELVPKTSSNFDG